MTIFCKVAICEWEAVAVLDGIYDPKGQQTMRFKPFPVCAQCRSAMESLATRADIQIDFTQLEYIELSELTDGELFKELLVGKYHESAEVLFEEHPELYIVQSVEDPAHVHITNGNGDFTLVVPLVQPRHEKLTWAEENLDWDGAALILAGKTDG